MTEFLRVTCSEYTNISFMQYSSSPISGQVLGFAVEDSCVFMVILYFTFTRSTVFIPDIFFNLEIKLFKASRLDTYSVISPS